MLSELIFCSPVGVGCCCFIVLELCKILVFVLIDLLEMNVNMLTVCAKR